MHVIFSAISITVFVGGPLLLFFGAHRSVIQQLADDKKPGATWIMAWAVPVSGFVSFICTMLFASHHGDVTAESLAAILGPSFVVFGIPFILGTACALWPRDVPQRLRFWGMFLMASNALQVWYFIVFPLTPLFSALKFNLTH